MRSVQTEQKRNETQRLSTCVLGLVPKRPSVRPQLCPSGSASFRSLLCSDHVREGAPSTVLLGAAGRTVHLGRLL